jgi:hypothetical protein
MTRKQAIQYRSGAGKNIFNPLKFRPGYFSRFHYALILLMLLAGASLPVHSDNPQYANIPDIALLATTPRQHAVLLQPDRQLITLTLDDELGVSGARIVEILADRIVLQQKALDNDHPPRLIWLYLTESPDLPSRTVILDRTPPAQPLTLQPAMTTLALPAATARRY